jgi:hypothetical protein
MDDVLLFFAAFKSFEKSREVANAIVASFFNHGCLLFFPSDKMLLVLFVSGMILRIVVNYITLLYIFYTRSQMFIKKLLY